MKHVLFWMILYTCFANIAFAQCPPPCLNADSCLRQYYMGTKRILYYSNFPIDKANNCVERIVIAVQGAERNAKSRYQAALRAARDLDLEDRVLIISPSFKTIDDDPRTNELYWSSHGWKQGNTSVNSGTKISSFAVVDSLVSNILNDGKFTNITHAVISGHSAGGQYSQMYALTSTITDQHPDIFFRFVVMNPSNYTYLNGLRPRPDYWHVFDLPVYWDGRRWKMQPYYRSIAGDCPTAYDDYKYGLQERNNYSEDLSNSELIYQYTAREVYYFLGALDNDPNHDSLDISCEAKLQGRHRLERGLRYFDFLNIYHSGHNHSGGVIDGVGHDASGMYGAAMVKEAIFGDNTDDRQRY